MTPHDETSWRDYSEQFRTHTFPKIVASAALISISGDTARADLSVQACTELGASLLLDKPLLLIVPPGVTPPSRLLKAADIVLSDFDLGDPASQAALAEATTRIIALGGTDGA